MATNAEILARLDVPALCRELIPSLKPVGNDGKQALGLCPFHGDNKRSLSVRLENGAFNCKACGKRGTGIVGLFQAVKGLEFGEAHNEMERRAGLAVTVFGGKQKKPKPFRFEYFDQEGTLVYFKERWQTPEGKRFVFLHLDENGHRQVGKPNGNPALLYRLPEVLRADTVYVTEGEAHADFLHGWGITATSLDCGAMSKLNPEQVEQLTGKNLIVLPDNDDPGRGYAEHIATTMRGKAASIKVVTLPGLPEKGDVLDWRQLPGNDKAKLMQLVDVTPVWEPTEVNTDTGKDTVRLSDTDKQRVFPRAYIDTARLFNDPRRGFLKLGHGALFDSLVLRLAHAPGARLPNHPEGISRQLETDADNAEVLINRALEHGLLVLDTDGFLTSPMIAEWFAQAITTCAKNRESGAKGGKTSRRKQRKK